MIKDEDSRESTEDDTDCCYRFWDMWPRSINTDLERINAAVGKENVRNKESYKRSIRLVEKEEYLIFHALMIASIIYVQQGAMLWKDICKSVKNQREGLSGDPDFGKFMKWWRFKQIKFFISIVMENTTMRDDGVD